MNSRSDLYPQRGLGSIPRLSSMEGNGKYYTSDIDKRIDLFINAESYMQEEILKFRDNLNNEDTLNRFLPPHLVLEFQSKHWQRALKDEGDSELLLFDDYEENTELSSFSSDTDEMSEHD